MTVFFIQDFDADKIGLNLTAAVTLVFMVGLKDDLTVLAPLTKMGSQLTAIAFV